MFRMIIFYSCIAVCLSTALTGCGIKPDNVEPPPGAEAQNFPRTYPDPSTDPR